MAKNTTQVTLAEEIELFVSLTVFSMLTMMHMLDELECCCSFLGEEDNNWDASVTPHVRTLTYMLVCWCAWA